MKVRNTRESSLKRPVFFLNLRRRSEFGKLSELSVCSVTPSNDVPIDLSTWEESETEMEEQLKPPFEVFNSLLPAVTRRILVKK